MDDIRSGTKLNNIYPVKKESLDTTYEISKTLTHITNETYIVNHYLQKTVTHNRNRDNYENWKFREKKSLNTSMCPKKTQV